jgi:hypothetical protein
MMPLGRKKGTYRGAIDRIDIKVHPGALVFLAPQEAKRRARRRT